VLAPLLALAAGLGLLIVAADAFVLGASRLSLLLRVSPVVVGAVVIGFGTSAPELLVSGLAAGQGSLDIAVGNVVGSNIANVTLVAAVAAVIAPIVVSSQTLRREAPLAAGAGVALAFALQGGLTRVEGTLLLVAFAGAMWWLLSAARDGADPLGVEAQEALQGLEETTRRREWTRTGIALVGVVVAAQLVVRGARGIADELGLGEGFVGLTLVAVGTSLPEVVTAIQAARRGESHLVVGNLFGSNIFNSLLIGGVVALVGPGAIGDPDLTGLATVAMVAAGGLAWYLMGTRRKLVRWEGVLLLAVYLGLLPFVAR
jgi:cation:H+ antiporter